ncbi:MAG: iron-containing alcohol dehydrogenase [Oscillospiraceae bacterium]|nr:iron-containing alcohol dehydrogenase [Oscillospiraceae bacterium]
MHLLEKIFCRVVQFGFRTVLPVLPYKDPAVLNSVADIPAVLQQKGIDSVLLVTDDYLHSSGATKKLEQLLWSSHIRCYVYDGVCPNPTVDNVEGALQEYVRGGCQATIAFGGGSVIDCAKAVGARVAYPQKSIQQLKGLLRVLRKTPLLIAVPTAAGSGSEAALASLISEPEKKRKYVLYDFTLIPEYAVLDAEVTYTVPPHLTATIGMDAMTHAVEAYIGQTTTEQTRDYAKRAVKLIFENIETAYNDGRDHEARANMLYASHLAGIAFSKSYVGYIHTVAHSLGGQYNTPHGLANAVIMPYVLEAYGEAVYEKLHDLAVCAGVAKESDSHEAAAKRFICALRRLNYRMGIPTSLDCVKAEDIPVLAEHAAAEANPLYPVPVLMDAKELERFYYAIMEQPKAKKAENGRDIAA